MLSLSLPYTRNTFGSTHLCNGGLKGMVKFGEAQTIVKIFTGVLLSRAKLVVVVHAVNAVPIRSVVDKSRRHNR